MFDWGEHPMRIGIQIAGREIGFSIGKSLSPESAAFMTGEDVVDNGGAKLQLPYAQSPWVYIAVSRIAEKVSQIPFRISRVTGSQARRVRQLRSSSNPAHRRFVGKMLDETIIESGPAVDLFSRPHPLMSRQLFWEMVCTWNSLRGEFFILPLDKNDQPVDLSDRNPKVARLLTLPTELFWHVVQGYDFAGWRYTGSPMLTPIPSEMLLPTEVIHSRMPNPYDFWRGMSPMFVAAVTAGADYAASQYNKGYWMNNADTGVIVTTDQQATPEQRAAILAALRERKRKAGTADRPMFLAGGAKIEKPQLSGMESQFIENRKMNRQEIGAIFKVPESVMGFTDSKSSALSGGGQAIDAEQVTFVESTIGPLCCHIEAAIEPIVMTFGEDLIGWFDLYSLPVMQEARRQRLDAGVKAFAIGATFNDVNHLYDLGFPEYDWGNKSFLPFNLQEIGAQADMPAEDPPPADDAEKQNPFARAKNLFTALLENAGGAATPKEAGAARTTDTKLIWESHIKTRRKTVKLFQSKVSKVLTQYRASTLANLTALPLEKEIDTSPRLRVSAVNGVATTKSLIDLIFSSIAFGHSLANELKNPILATLQVAGQELRDEVGSDDPWTTPPEKAQQYLNSRTQPIMGVGGTVRDQLNTSLQEGLDNGETMDQLTARVRAVYNNLNEYEARRVAVTETNGAYNTARHASMIDAGIEYKAWLSSHGPNVRPAHAAAEMDYIDAPIPVDDPFLVDGEELMYPGDDSLGASAGNLINCQCVQLAAVKKEENETSLTFFIFGDGLRTFPKVAGAARTGGAA